MKEIWKSIIQFEGFYSISNLGNVRSEERVMQRVRSGKPYNYLIKEKILTPRKDRLGYLSVCLCKDKKIHQKLIHRLVLKAFGGPPSNPKDECNHKDGKPPNNHIDNLEWVSHTENLRHAVDILEKIRGEKHGACKLTKKEVLEIRQNTTLNQRQLAKKYKVNFSAIWKIIHRKRWTHI